MLRKVLLSCGIAGAVLSVAADASAIVRSAGCRFVAQSVSDLSGVGAPTRSLVLPLNLAAELLLIAFGVGVWMSAGGRRVLRVTAGLLMGDAILGVVVSAFFPMYLGEAVKTARNTRSVILGAASVIVLLLAIGSGVAASRRCFASTRLGPL